MLRNKGEKVGQTAHQLRAIDAFAENAGSVPNLQLLILGNPVLSPGI